MLTSRQMFLPEAFLHERESILALLRFKRVAFKSQLLNTFVKERVQAGHVQSGAEDLFIAACDICDKLTWVSAMCDRFIAYMMTCGVQQFTNFRGALLELDPVERAFNVWIDALRRDDLKEKQCAADLQRTMAVIGHLGEIHLIDNLEGYAYDVQMRVQLMQSHMESTAAAVSHIRTMVQEKATPTEGEVEIAGIFVKKADAIVSHARSTKVVVSKILRTLTDLQMRSLSLTMDTKSTFEQCEAATQKIADYSRALGNNLVELLYAEGETDPIPYSKVQSVMYRTTEKTIQIIETDMFSAFGKELRNLTNLLMDLASTASDLEMTAECITPPLILITLSR